MGLTKIKPAFEQLLIDQARVGTVIFGQARLLDRDEMEVRGYCDALKSIHEQGDQLPVSEETIQRLHQLSVPDVADAGQYKRRDSDIIEKHPDGWTRVRFRTVPATDTLAFMRELIAAWDNCLLERRVPPLIALAVMNLDFLCIHPFRDGNGRTSRLLLLLQSYHLGLEVGRYISLERLIEENKERYYETLALSSQGWHEGRHDPWPYINFLLFTLKTAYKEFEARAGDMASPRGAKAELVLSAIRGRRGEFRLSEIERACPGVGREWIRTLMLQLKQSGELTCEGKGPGARWTYHPDKAGQNAE